MTVARNLIMITHHLTWPPPPSLFFLSLHHNLVLYLKDSCFQRKFERNWRGKEKLHQNLQIKKMTHGISSSLLVGYGLMMYHVMFSLLPEQILRLNLEGWRRRWWGNLNSRICEGIHLFFHLAFSMLCHPPLHSALSLSLSLSPSSVPSETSSHHGEGKEGNIKCEKRMGGRRIQKEEILSLESGDPNARNVWICVFHSSLSSWPALIYIYSFPLYNQDQEERNPHDESKKEDGGGGVARMGKKTRWKIIDWFIHSSGSSIFWKKKLHIFLAGREGEEEM